ncbi:MAG TPA: PLP-dependent aminotransferase family protein [Rhodanobacter sp.]
MTGKAEQTLVDECVQWAINQIHGQVYRAGMRLPSIRALAAQRGVSPFTIVEAYARLVARGYLEARKGSGFYACARPVQGSWQAAAGTSRIDLQWLMRNMLADSGAQGPGLGVLPPSWLDAEQLATTLRALGRQGVGRWRESGRPRGFEPLRLVIQQRLAALDIAAHPEQIVLTTGITHALDLVLRSQLDPGDCVLVLEPSWFGALGMLAARGIRTISVPYTTQGPDLATMERLAMEHRPRLLILNSAAQNPTGLSLTQTMVTAMLALAARADLLIFEDDVYADLCRSPITRLAAVDRLDRVIYASSFSKTLAANIRVGYLACRPALAESLVDTKILSGFTTPELNERLVHKLLVEGRYVQHVRALRERLAGCRDATKTLLERAGVDIFGDPVDGMFLWVNLHTDTNALAVACREQGLLVAPGSLFSPLQAASPWMRFNITTTSNVATQVLRSAGLAGV